MTAIKTLQDYLLKEGIEGRSFRGSIYLDKLGNAGVSSKFDIIYKVNGLSVSVERHQGSGFANFSSPYSTKCLDLKVEFKAPQGFATRNTFSITDHLTDQEARELPCPRPLGAPHCGHSSLDDD